MNQKKSTPSKNPIKRGGSPSGVEIPPILAIKKIKKTSICVLYFLFAFALNKGRINNVAAPVVPINPESKLPKNKKLTLNIGPFARGKSIKIPPETIYKADIKIMNGI